MKKIFYLLFSLAFLFSLASCQLGNNNTNEDIPSGEDNTDNKEDDDDNGNQDGNEDETPVSTLAVPVLVIEGDTGIVSWEVVSEATHYNYIINDGEILTTTTNTLTIPNQSSVSVQAANDECVSDWSYAVTNFDTSDVYEEYVETVYVKFHNTDLTCVAVEYGEIITEPVAPDKANYTFDNWYADPFYLEVFDFNQPITSDTIVYANYLENALLANTYYWVKGSAHISGSVMSEGTSSDWHFIPLKLNENNTSFKEYYATVTVTGATSTNPAAFIVMDGFTNDSGRTYWKNNGSDFTIYSDGTYNIYFTVESEYASGINARYEIATNSVSDAKYKNKVSLNTPVVTVNSENNIASWNRIGRATSYEVIIDNKEVVTTNYTTITLNKGSHITVRAVGKNEYSNWSIPKANINHIVVSPDGDNRYSVYFVGYESYKVEQNTNVTAPLDPNIEDFTFGGWYLDYACTVAAQFPYTVTANVVFYPKWVADSDYETKVYYNLVTETGAYIKGLTWNLDNYTFDEYETGVVELAAGTNYYVVDADDETVKYGPYTVSETGRYKIYFSEENSWDGSNIYIAKTETRIYFSNSKRWSDTVYVYLWNSSTNNHAASWPGVEMIYLETNSYGEQIYYVDVDLSLYDSMIISHGTNKVVVTQTIDILLNNYSSNGFYVTSKNSEGKYEIGTYSR